ncbi:ABC transporter ATP-binding protein [Pseudochelatococcus sp. B33]
METGTLIEFRGVGKAFGTSAKTEIAVVSNLTFGIARGDFFCLLGPSGCGKTTVLGMLAGFERPTTGELLSEGRPVDGPSRDRGVVFQGDDSLYGWLTAAENVEFGLRLRGMSAPERRKVAERYLELVGLAGQGSKYPSQLSGGMKQRTQIARALANEPYVLLMDEPFGALDAQTREVMQRELRAIWETTGVTIFFITHDIDEAITLGSRVGIMTGGPDARMREVLSIDLDAERDRSDPAYLAYYSRIHKAIREEAAISGRRFRENAA